MAARGCPRALKGVNPALVNPVLQNISKNMAMNSWQPCFANRACFRMVFRPQDGHVYVYSETRGLPGVLREGQPNLQKFDQLPNSASRKWEGRATKLLHAIVWRAPIPDTNHCNYCCTIAKLLRTSIANLLRICFNFLCAYPRQKSERAHAPSQLGNNTPAIPQGAGPS